MNLETLSCPTNEAAHGRLREPEITVRSSPAHQNGKRDAARNEWSAFPLILQTNLRRRRMAWRLGTPAIALVLALSACGDNGQDSSQVAGGQGDYQARLQAMPEGQRNAVFIRALRDAGRPCQGVENSTYRGVRDGVPTWTARCTAGGGDWLILLGAGGVVQVVSAAEAVRGGLAAPEAGNTQ
jgi:hypothetical protein